MIKQKRTSSRMRIFWSNMLAEQVQWIARCGGDLAGYIDSYHGKYKRTVEDATAIYQADIAELERIQNRVNSYA